MKSNGLGLMGIMAGVFLLTSLSFAQEIQIIHDPADQAYPAIWQNRIVYSDSRHGNGEIYLFDLVSQSEVRITNHPANQRSPAIYQDSVVYVDDRNLNEDIYFFDLASLTETRITTDPYDQILPAIGGNYLVWQDWRTAYDNPCICLPGIPGPDDPGGDVPCWDWFTELTPTLYLFNLSSSLEMQLSSGTFWTDLGRGPSLYGSRVAWENHSSSSIRASCGEPVFWPQLDSGWLSPIISVTELPVLARRDILTYPRQGITPDIFENLVAYSDPVIYSGDFNYPFPPPALYLFDLASSTERNLGVRGFYPAIWQNFLVYIRDTNSPPPPAYRFYQYPTYPGAQCHLFLYDLTTSTETQITTAPVMFAPPDLYEDKVVYTANRSGNLDIFMYLIPPSRLEITPDSAGLSEGDSAGFQALAIWSDGRTQQVACDSETTWAITGDLVEGSCSGNRKKVSALDLPGPAGGFGTVNAGYRGVSDPVASLVEVLNNDLAVLTPPPQGPLLSPNYSDHDQNFPNCGAVAEGPSSLAVLGLLLLALRGCRRLIRPD